MSHRNHAHKRRFRIVLYLWLLLVLLSLLTVASYTWFSLSRTPRVSDMNMYINAQSGMEISPDIKAEEWHRQLDFRDIVSETAPLRPVTWSDQDQCFYAAAYGVDGRQMDYESWHRLNDNDHANKDDAYGYYIKTTIYARADVALDVRLSEAVEVDEGINGSGTYVIGTPVWNQERVLHSNGGQGAECAIRIGIRTTTVDENGEPTGAASQFFIYEPNSDAHPDGTAEYIATPSIDGTEHLIAQNNLIRQTASTWSEAYPVERSVVIRDLGEFLSTPVLFQIAPGEFVKIDIYVWLEGQDVDCTNEIEAAQILASIQFAGDPGSQSGMKPIE